MAVQELFWIPRLKNRKTGETSAFKTKAAFVSAVDSKHALVYVEPTDKVTGFAGSLLDIPDGEYLIKGPGFKRFTWEATLTVVQRVNPVYTVI